MHIQDLRPELSVDKTENRGHFKVNREFLSKLNQGNDAYKSSPILAELAAFVSRIVASGRR